MDSVKLATSSWSEASARPERDGSEEAVEANANAVTTDENFMVIGGGADAMQTLQVGSFDGFRSALRKLTRSSDATWEEDQMIIIKEADVTPAGLSGDG